MGLEQGVGEAHLVPEVGEADRRAPDKYSSCTIREIGTLRRRRTRVAIYRLATALRYPPLKLVSTALQSTATRTNRARDEGLAPQVRMQEPRREPAADPFQHDPTRSYTGPTYPGGTSIGF